VTAETTPTDSTLTYAYDAWRNDNFLYRCKRHDVYAGIHEDEQAERRDGGEREYDEAGTVKFVTSGSTSVYYDMKDGTYQSDAYDLVTSMN
jgi:hypothetical protein